MKLISFCLTILFTFICLTDLKAQQDEGVHFELSFNQNDYKMLQERVGEKGVSADEFARWIGSNGRFIVLKPGEDLSELPKSARLTVFAMDERGSIVGEHGMRIRTAERSTNLERLVNISELSQIFKRLFPDANFYPDSVFLSESYFFPDTLFNTMNGVTRAVAEAGRKVAGSKSESVSFVLTVTPDSDRFEVPTQPGYVLFAGHLIGPNR